MFFYYFGSLWLFALKSGQVGSYTGFSNAKCLWYSPMQKQIDIGFVFVILCFAQIHFC